MNILTLDLGGTKTACALFDGDGQIVDDYVHVVQSVTYDGEMSVYENSCRTVENVMERFRHLSGSIAAMGVGAPGPLDTETGVILHAPMMGWRNFPLIGRLREKFHFSAFLDNDANLGALAEQRAGLGRGKRHVAYMTISTGIGGGLVLNGEIFHGMHDGAGEFGHMSLFPDGPECPCGNRGCLELYASGTAIKKRLEIDRARGVQSVMFRGEGATGELSTAALARAASLGDGYALEVFEAVGNWLGVAIANILNLLDVELIVLGGGVTKAQEFFGESMYRTIKSRCIQPFDQGRVRFSELNDRAVLVGAFYMARDRLKKMD